MVSGKVLLIRFSSLGDVALVSPLFSILKKRKFEVHFLTRKLPALLYYGDPRVERIFALEEYESQKDLVNDLKKEHYDFIVDLHLQPRSIIISQQLRLHSGKIYRYQKESFQRYMLLYLKRQVITIHHAIYRYLAALKFIDSPQNLWNEALRMLKMPFFKEEIDEALAVMDNSVFRRGVVFLAPGANWKQKQWGPDKYAQLAEKVNSLGYSVAVVGGEQERPLSDLILKNSDGIDLTGLNPRKTVLILTMGKLLVTNDSAHQHLGMLAGIPVAVIFGPTVPEFGFYPLGKKDIIIQKKLSCRPCSLHGEKKCKRGDLLCMSSITPEEVMEKIRGILNE